MTNLDGVAFVFPGQGSQRVGMVGDWLESHPHLGPIGQKANDILGINLIHLCSRGPNEELQKTINTQPGMLLAGYLAFKALEAKPAMSAGHSLGEYTALVAAGALDFEDALRLVRKRGQLMQEAVPEGEGAMMAVLGGEAEAIAAACEAVEGVVEGVVEIANYNAPGQHIVSGKVRAVEVLKSRLEGVRCTMLPVSAPFHCSLMQPVQEALRPEIEKVRIKNPAWPVVNNVAAEPVVDSAAVREGLIRQIAAPVRWEETIRRMRDSGIHTIVEVGPGGVLHGLTKRIDPDLKRLALSRQSDLIEVRQRLGLS